MTTKLEVEVLTFQDYLSVDVSILVEEVERGFAL